METNEYSYGKWKTLAKHAALMHELNQASGALDYCTTVKRRACLGTATTLMEDASLLFLTGFFLEAKNYFALIERYATAAREANERYIYEDPDGNNHFGLYSAARISAAARWMLGRPDWHSQLLIALHHYQKALALAELNSSRACANLLLLLEQLDSETCGDCSHPPNQPPWSALCSILTGCQPVDSASARKPLRTWLSSQSIEIVDAALSENITASEALAVAAILGKREGITTAPIAAALLRFANCKDARAFVASYDSC